VKSSEVYTTAITEMHEHEKKNGLHSPLRDSLHGEEVMLRPKKKDDVFSEFRFWRILSDTNHAFEFLNHSQNHPCVAQVGWTCPRQYRLVTTTLQEGEERDRRRRMEQRVTTRKRREYGLYRK